MRTMRTNPRAASLVLALGLFGCAHARNYPDPAGPRFAGQFADLPAERPIRVVSFNIKYGRNVKGAAELLRADVRLKDADVIALQEMDETGVECLARTLRLNYGYYPAAVHPAGAGVQRASRDSGRRRPLRQAGPGAYHRGAGAGIPSRAGGGRLQRARVHRERLPVRGVPVAHARRRAHDLAL